MKGTVEKIINKKGFDDGCFNELSLISESPSPTTTNQRTISRNTHSLVSVMLVNGAIGWMADIWLVGGDEVRDPWREDIRLLLEKPGLLMSLPPARCCCRDDNVPRWSSSAVYGNR